jgi:hypothetical protein
MPCPACTARERPRERTSTIKQTRTASPWSNLLNGPEQGTQAQTIDVDLFSSLEEEKYPPGGPLDTRSFVLNYCRIRLWDQIKVQGTHLGLNQIFGPLLRARDQWAPLREREVPLKPPPLLPPHRNLF